MVSSRLILCAKSIVHDSTKNTLSVDTILENVASLTYPVEVAQMDFLIVLDKEPTDPDSYDCVLRISVDDKNIIDLDATVNFSGQQKTRLVERIYNYPIPRPGNLKFTFLLNEKCLDEYVVKAEVIKT